MKIDPSTLDLKEKVVHIGRVTKVVKGGRNFRFAALVVVGDENGHVGVGMGKSIEIPEAIRKGVEDAKKNLVKVEIVGTTVPHKINGLFGTGNVLIMPATEGTGVLAGGPARAVLELSGIKDVSAKSLGFNNPSNVARTMPAKAIMIVFKSPTRKTLPCVSSSVYEMGDWSIPKPAVPFKKSNPVWMPLCSIFATVLLPIYHKKATSPTTVKN